MTHLPDLTSGSRSARRIVCSLPSVPTRVRLVAVSFARVLANEAATSLTLVGTDGKEHTILRADLEPLVRSGRWVMPGGLGTDLSVEQMADLMTFVRATLPAPKPKSFPGNKPAVVRPGADGALRLPATAAEVYGPTLTFEERYQNLGYWGSADDRAVWTVTVPTA